MMFFLGAHIDSTADISVVAVIRKNMRNIKNYYTVAALFQASAAQCEKRLTDLYWDKKYLVRKRVFSQDRRGKKDVDAHPKIVVAGSGQAVPEVVSKLRQAHVPADSLSVLPAEDVVPKMPAPTGIGRDFFVFENDLIDTVVALLSQGRLLIEPEDNGAAGPNRFGVTDFGALLAGIAETRCLPVDKAEQIIFMAMAAPVWFRENVRYRQSYQSSARSVRRFT